MPLSKRSVRSAWRWFSAFQRWRLGLTATMMLVTSYLRFLHTTWSLHLVNSFIESCTISLLVYFTTAKLHVILGQWERATRHNWNVSSRVVSEGHYRPTACLVQLSWQLTCFVKALTTSIQLCGDIESISAGTATVGWMLLFFDTKALFKRIWRTSALQSSWAHVSTKRLNEFLDAPHSVHMSY